MRWKSLWNSHPDPEKAASPTGKKYTYWRFRTFYSIYFGYVLFYFTRKSFTFAMPSLIAEEGYTTSELGFLASLLYVTYGFSKFLGGMVSDRYSPRLVMAVGLAMTALTNIFFGCSSSILFFALFWGLNGLFQGCGWPPCTKQLTHWFSQKERGFFWSLKSTSHNVGGALIPLLVASISSYLGWRYSLIIPGVICLIGSLILFERLRNVPESVGLPEIEKFRDEEELHPPSSPNLSAKDIFIEKVLKNKFITLLSIAYFFVYVIRTGLNDWGVLYLVEHRGYTLVQAATSITWFEIGGFAGSLAAGWGSDFFFNGRRVPLMAFCSVSLIGVLWLFGQNMHPGLYTDYLIMGTIGFLIFVPQLLVGLAAAEYVEKGAACTANGFVGCFGYIGAAASGYPLGKVIENFGWQGYFAINILCAVVVVLILLPMWKSNSSAEVPAYSA